MKRTLCVGFFLPKQTFNWSFIVGDNEMEDVESRTAGGRDVITDEKSGVTVGGINDGQHVDVMVRLVSDPAYWVPHVRQATSAGHQL